MNPLLFVNEALEARDHAFRTVTNCVLDPALAPGVAATMFEPPNVNLCEVQLDAARQEWDDLAVLGMAAAFEARVKEYLLQQVEVSASSYRAAIDNWLTRRIEDSPLSRLGELFKPPVTKAMLDDVDRIRTYRNWVAHGRATHRRPAYLVTPQLAFTTLTGFLATAGLI